MSGSPSRSEGVFRNEVKWCTTPPAKRGGIPKRSEEGGCNVWTDTPILAEARIAPSLGNEGEFCVAPLDSRVHGNDTWSKLKTLSS